MHIGPDDDGRGFVFTENTRLDLEVLISDITSRFVHTPTSQLDSVIEDSLQEIIDFLSLDRAVLWQQEEPNSKRFILTHLRFKPGCGPDDKPFLTTDSFPWLTAQLLNGHETRYSRIDDLPEEAAVDKATIQKYAPKYSAMAFPLFNGEKVYGILTFGKVQEIIWPERLIPRLRVVAHVFSGALLRKKSDEKLHQTLQELEKLKGQLERENVYLRQEINVRSSPSRIVYQSRAMTEVLAKVEQVAPTNATVLLSGETGTGKEMVASAIHELSSRSQRAMVRVNCGAIPAALVESEMFGREKGAYTGALSRQVGRFEFADSSTIFLDEVSELPMEVQVKLLRVLQEKEIERLGNPKPIRIDVRVIAATNQNLEKAVHEGKFRQDLYYRLNVFPIEIPPLRERREDIPKLVWSFIDELSNELGKKVESISSKSMEALMDYHWPGNVRELRNVIERAMIVSNSPKLYVEIPKSSSASLASPALTLKEAEIQHIRRVLENASWKIRGKHGAAEILGMKPTTLETRMAKLGITRPDNRDRQTITAQKS
ncbi:MAG TPA: sigma 54-interacting transcriptional regulator [Acidobacteriota bacterium]|nr:sigma 54-interacting transcriptional regulator [Acidobacteriota bacterium]